MVQRVRIQKLSLVTTAEWQRDIQLISDYQEQ